MHTVYSKREELLSYLNNSPDYKHLGKGCTREVFLCPSKKTVVKVLTYDSRGYESPNDLEYKNYRKSFDPKQNPSGVRIARCWKGVFRGVEVLYMEKVQPLATPEQWFKWAERFDKFKAAHKDIPNWVEKLDCYQVGFNAKKEYVAFDVGNSCFRF